MSAPEHLIGRLAELAPRDRDWILAHLSAAAKANLLQHLGRAQPAATADGPQAMGDDERALDEVEGELVARHLAGEPAWVVAQILSLRPWSWDQRVLMNLVPGARLEVNQLRQSLLRPSMAMRALIIRTLREQVTAGPPGGRFEDLMDQVGDRRP